MTMRAVSCFTAPETAWTCGPIALCRSDDGLPLPGDIAHSEWWVYMQCKLRLNTSHSDPEWPHQLRFAVKQVYSCLY